MSFNRSSKRPVGTSWPSSAETSPSRGLVVIPLNSKSVVARLDTMIHYLEDHLGGAGGASNQTSSTLKQNEQAMEEFRATQLDLRIKWNATLIDEGMMWVRRGELILSLDVAIIDLQAKYPSWKLDIEPIKIYKETFGTITEGMAEKYKQAYFDWKNKRTFISSLVEQGIELPEELKEATYDEIVDYVKTQGTSHDAYIKVLETNPALKAQLEEETRKKLRKYKAAQEKAQKTKAANKKKKENQGADGQATEDNDIVIEDDDGGEGIGEEGGESEQETSDGESDGGDEKDDEKTTSKSEMKALLTEAKVAKGKPGLEVAVGDKFVEYFVRFSTDDRIKKGLVKVWDAMTISMRGHIVPKLFPNVPRLLAVEEVFGLSEMVKLEEYFARRNAVTSNDFAVFGSDLIQTFEKCDVRGREALLRLFLDVTKNVARNTAYPDLVERLRAPTPRPQDSIDKDSIFPLSEDGRKNKASSKNAGKYAKFVDGWKVSTGSEWVVVEDANVIVTLDFVFAGSDQDVEDVTEGIDNIYI